MAGNIQCHAEKIHYVLDVSEVILICSVCVMYTKGLVTNYGEGGATKREGGAREVLPL